MSQADAPGSAAPRISVVVVGVGDSPALRRCLACIAPQAREADAEVILVLNCAEECVEPASREDLARLSDSLRFEPRIGKSHALNLGVDACRGEVIAFTDDDALPEGGWLEALCAPLLSGRSDAPVGCGGRVLPDAREPGPPRWYRALLDRKETSFLGPRHDLGPGDREYRFDAQRWVVPVGASCAYRREVFERHRYRPELGPNRETGMRGGEDSELALRLLRDGQRLLYRGEARVLHPVSAERTRPEFVARSYYMAGVERVRVCRALGLAPPSRSRVRVNRMLGRLKGWARQLVRAPGLLHADFKQEYRRGLLDELARPAAARGSDRRSDPR